MKKINWIALALLGVTAAAHAGNGRVGSGSDGLIFEAGKAPSDAVVTVGTFGSIEVRGDENGELDGVSFFRCGSLDADGSPKMNSCSYVARSSINKKTALTPSNYLVKYFGVFYPTLVPVIKDTNTVIRLQKIALADNDGQANYAVSRDLSSPEMLANLRMGYFSTISSLDDTKQYCDNSKVSNPQLDDLCDAIKTQNKALILEKLFPIINWAGSPYIAQIYVDKHEDCAGIPFTDLCGPTFTKYNVKFAKYWPEGEGSSLKTEIRSVSVFPGVYQITVQGETYNGITVPMPN